MFVSLDDWPNWSLELGDWLDRRFDPSVISALSASSEPDWLTWLDTQQAMLDGQHQDSVELFERVVHERYLGVRVIHATRLSNIGSVARDGLRAWSQEGLRTHALAMFGGVTEPANLERAIARCAPQHRAGLVYSFSSLHYALGQPEFRPGRLPAFAVSGGEFISCVGLGLGNVACLPRAEMERGYLLACNLAWNRLDERDVLWLSKAMLLTVITSRRFDTAEYNMFGDRECIATAYDIAPRDIVQIADVEALVGREGITCGDVIWRDFP